MFKQVKYTKKNMFNNKYNNQKQIKNKLTNKLKAYLVMPYHYSHQKNS